jgi:L-asparaginase
MNEWLILFILIAGAGAGGVTTLFNYAVEDVPNNYKIPVVQSMRVNSGEVPLSDISSQTAMHVASG